MHHKTKEAAVKKYSEAGYESIPVLVQTIKADNHELTDEDASAIIEGIILKKQAPTGAVAAAVKEAVSNVEMKRYDLLRGYLQVRRSRKIPGTGQTQVMEVQFEISDPKPKQSASMPPKVANDINQSRFTARYQVSELYFPQGKKLDYWWIYNDNTEVFDFIVRELETA